MTEWTDFLSALGWCFFGIAAVLMTIFLLKMVSHFDRIITLAEKGMLKRLPSSPTKLILGCSCSGWNG